MTHKRPSIPGGAVPLYQPQISTDGLTWSPVGEQTDLRTHAIATAERLAEFTAGLPGEGVPVWRNKK